jgi:amidophosphoribosyltransferase
VFDGVYVTGDVTPEYLQALEANRNDVAKTAHGSFSENVIDLYNSA